MCVCVCDTPKAGLAGPLDPVLAMLVRCHTFEEVATCITNIYEVRWPQNPIPKTQNPNPKP